MPGSSPLRQQVAQVMDAELLGPDSLPYGSSSVSSSTLSSALLGQTGPSDGGAGPLPYAPAAAELAHGLPPDAEATARWDRTMSWAARDSAQARPACTFVLARGSTGDVRRAPVLF